MDAEETLDQLVADYFFSTWEYEPLESEKQLLTSFAKYVTKRAEEKKESTVDPIQRRYLERMRSKED